MSLTETCLGYCSVRLRAWIKNETGASLVEYALLLALIAVFCVAAVTMIGDTTRSSLSSSSSKLS